MFRSLAVKLALAFLAVSLMGVALLAVSIHQSTEKEFDRFLLDQRQSDFVAYSTAYYQENNSWDGVDEMLRQQLLLPLLDQPSPFASAEPGNKQPAPPLIQQPGIVPPVGAQPIVLADQRGYVVVSGGPFQVGSRVPPLELERGVQIKVDDRLVGTVLDTAAPPDRHPAEERYLERANQVLFKAALAATGIAIVLGLGLARTLTHPLRELTAAIRQMAKGVLKQHVPVRSQDELGELAVAFNQMSADLDRSNELRRQMMADIAHDLRTPLAVIKGYTEALRDGDLPLTADTFQTMYQEAELLSYLINDLRTLSLADAGELALNCVPVFPRELLERTAAAYLPQAKQAEIAIQVEVDANVQPVLMDPDRMAQVLGNLVSNALRYTPAGGQILLSATRSDDNVLLVVKDTGVGITPEKLPRIFDRLYRDDETRPAHEGESGLGLAIAKSLVELHGAKIDAASTVGEGTTFTITLPPGDGSGGRD